MWTLLWQFKNQIGIALVVVGIVGYIAILKAETSHYKSKVLNLQAQLNTANVEIESAQTTIARLSTAVQNLSDEGKRKQANAKALQKKYEDNEKQWKERLGGLVSWVPIPKEGECDAAKRIISDYRKR